MKLENKRLTISEIESNLFDDKTEINKNLLGDYFHIPITTRTFLGFDSCQTNALAERDDSVIKALCYDAED